MRDFYDYVTISVHAIRNDTILHYKHFPTKSVILARYFSNEISLLSNAKRENSDFHLEVPVLDTVKLRENPFNCHRGPLPVIIEHHG